MNNSLGRLIDGMIETLRRDIIPATDGEFVRGQAFGIIFLLESIKARGGWSPAFLGEQIAALDELRVAIDAIEGLPTDMPQLSARDAISEAARDAGDAEVAALIDWLADTPNPTVSAAIDAYLARQIRHEISTSARPIFAEISLGREQKAPA